MNESEIRKELIDAREEYIKIIKSELLGDTFSAGKSNESG